MALSFSLLSLGSYAQWSSSGGNETITTGIVGIGTSSPATILEVHQPTVLGTTAGSSIELGRFSGSSGNGSQLRFLLNRFNAGNDWTGASTRIQAWTDVSPQGYIDFNPSNSLSGMAFGAGSNEYMRITQTGLIGIWTNNPVGSFEVHSPGTLGTSQGSTSEMARFYCSTGNGSMLKILANRFTAGNGWTSASTRIQAVTDATNQAYIDFNPNGGTYGLALGTGSGEVFRITSNNTVLIGKTSQVNTGYILDINGNTRANEVVVNASGADFVFDPGYHLPSLKELDAYVRREHHLPDIAPAAQMQKDGVDLGANQTRLLQKIEELTLYTIQQDKEMNSLKDKVHRLEEQNSRLEDLLKRIERLEHSQNSTLDK